MYKFSKDNQQVTTHPDRLPVLLTCLGVSMLVMIGWLMFSSVFSPAKAIAFAEHYILVIASFLSGAYWQRALDPSMHNRHSALIVSNVLTCLLWLTSLLSIRWLFQLTYLVTLIIYLYVDCQVYKRQGLSWQYLAARFFATAGLCYAAVLLMHAHYFFA